MKNNLGSKICVSIGFTIIFIGLSAVGIDSWSPGFWSKLFPSDSPNFVSSYERPGARYSSAENHPNLEKRLTRQGEICDEILRKQKQQQRNTNSSIEDKLALENEVWQLQQIYNRNYRQMIDEGGISFSANVRQMELEKQIRALMKKYKENYGEVEWTKFYNRQEQVFK